MKPYFGAWGFLLSLTAIEVALAYRHTPPVMMLTVLLALSFLKAGAIVTRFMHIAGEGARLAWLVLPAFFFIGLILLGILGDAGPAAYGAAQ
ncbi:MAG: cytochrome C oxidase subunit IV family protein [Bryobacterales bacterium]|nr:cytochrome C oxidase subunit IV family protein [Bryobacterales bacterium]